MIKFGQQNYPKLYLGKTRYTFARYGCLSDVIIMGYDWLFGKSKTPDQIVPQLSYNSDGMLLWDSLKVLGLQLKCRVAKSKNPFGTIDYWWKDNSVFCALEINNGVHFVWQVGRWYPLLGYRIFDPWENRIKFLKSGITGCRVIGKI